MSTSFMNTAPEFEVIRKWAAELSPSELGEIFDRCSDVSEGIRTTQLYSMLHDKPELCGQLVNSLSEALQFEGSDQPSRVRFWLQGLCLISKQRDKDALFEQNNNLHYNAIGGRARALSGYRARLERILRRIEEQPRRRKMKFTVTLAALLALAASALADTYRVHYGVRGSGRDITVQAATSAESRRTVMDMIPGAVVTGAHRIK
jgi:hypothetical protein